MLALLRVLLSKSHVLVYLRNKQIQKRRMFSHPLIRNLWAHNTWDWVRMQAATLNTIPRSHVDGSEAHNFNHMSHHHCLPPTFLISSKLDSGTRLAIKTRCGTCNSFSLSLLPPHTHMYIDDITYTHMFIYTYMHACIIYVNANVFHVQFSEHGDTTNLSPFLCFHFTSFFPHFYFHF